jgi:alpha-mannosidase
MATKKPVRPAYEAHYISGTHWDREWYRPFQEYRLLLVELLDQLLDQMEHNPKFKHFHLDGQTCVLADYVEVRPENRARLARLIRQGRILIGPWYTMPDLFCVGDEALIRNLITGRRIAREWGVEPMPVAYTCDMFGHPSQMPQIYRGFDLPHCVLGRGTNEHNTPPYFRWQSPDGSDVFCFKLQDKMGYGPFFEVRKLLENYEGLPVTPEALAEAKANLREYLDHEAGRANSNVLCLMDALDHTLPAADISRYLDMIHEIRPDFRPQNSAMPDFFRQAEASARKVPVRRGELREPSRDQCGYLWLIPNCVSARPRIKLANDKVQNLLGFRTEPLMALAQTENVQTPPKRLLQIAWENVLLNHAHDSICGCSIDQVHRDNLHRFEQATVLAEQLQHKTFAALTRRCANPATGKDEFSITLFNPLPQPRREVTVFDIDLPVDYPYAFKEGFRSQMVKSFTLTDLDGNDIPCQRMGFVAKTNERSHLAKPYFGSNGPFTRYTVGAEVALPGMGFTTLVVKPAQTAVRTSGTLRTGPNSAANKHLAIQIESNGTVTLTDLRTGAAYRDLLTFEDRSEIGDGWFHNHAVNDETALSTACAAEVAVVHDGPLVVTFRVSLTLQVPMCYDRGKEAPAPVKTGLRLHSLITLRKDADRLDIETTVENTVKDHRLRVLLPTDARRAKTWLAHHPFDIVERPITIDAKTATWQEMELYEKPFLGLQAVGDGTRGLAFISAGGLHEGGVMDDARRTMHVTLLRAFHYTVNTEGESDGQEQGTLTYRYALQPFHGKFPAATALGHLARLQSGILTRQTGARCSGYPAMQGREKPEQSFLKQEKGSLVFSAMKPAESGNEIVVRFWNPAHVAATETLTFGRTVAGARYLNLAEEKTPAGARPAAKGRQVRISAPPHGIITLGITLK